VVAGAAQELKRLIGSIEVDAAPGRQASEVIDVLRARKAAGELCPVVLLQLGNNGQLSRSQLDEMMQILFDFPSILLVNLRVARPWESSNNALLIEVADRYPNVILIDWAGASANRPELFLQDQVHLSPLGATTYADLIARQLRTFGIEAAPCAQNGTS
jgi:hypothetical protein